jgi:hypothetical protein
MPAVLAETKFVKRNVTVRNGRNPNHHFCLDDSLFCRLLEPFECSSLILRHVALVCEGKTTKLRYFPGGNPVHQALNTPPVKEWPPMPEFTVVGTPLQPGFGQALKE